MKEEKMFVNLSNREIDVFQSMICKIDNKCREYAIKKLNKNDWMLMKDLMILKGDNEDYPIKTKNKESYVIKPSSRKKYNKYYYEKLYK